eukprot:scaffold3410_cov158-Amphora_coffeaeformis.AAC.18
MPSLESSELILHAETNRVYHLNVKAADVADYIILVGDPARVDRVAAQFDSIDYTSVNREFVVKTGVYQGLRITALSTDAALNIDPETRQVNGTLRKLTLIRLGTCGALQSDIQIDSTIVSAAVLGFDGVAHFYQTDHDSDSTNDNKSNNNDMATQFMSHVNPWPVHWNRPYARLASPVLLQHFGDLGTHGITLTANGFFGPQGRSIRLPLVMPNMNERFRNFTYSDDQGNNNASKTTWRVTNFEMECSALYALGQALGHDTLTMCVAIANRYAGQFSKDYHPAVDRLIVDTLDKLVSLHANKLQSAASGNTSLNAVVN